mgnify:CR=1 FL=1
MRGKKAPKRDRQKDSVYQSETVARFINYVMLDGKKTLAEKSVYHAIEEGAKQVKKEPMELLEGALNNVKPALEVRSRRVGGANYQVPVPVDEERQEALALRWLIKGARGKKGKDFHEFLTSELVQAFKGEGEAVRMKEDTEKMAEANKAFAHFRW